MRDVLSATLGKVIGYNDAPAISEPYKGFTIEQVSTRYSLNGAA
ncbi:hypothetical protein AGMMS50229_04340 [Campylobacterota bacterium]|nr:hypothetical protein AGMMS50229_04340 [Campylobacterota bacterium]